MALGTAHETPAAAILAASLTVLRRDGVEALTMRNVGATAGVSATALYRHISDKDELIDIVVRHVYDEFVGSLSAQAGDGDALALAFTRYLQFALRKPNEYLLLFATPHRRVDVYPTGFREKGSRGFQLLRSVVAAAIEDGRLRGPASDAGDIALTIFAHMHGLVMLHLTGRFAGDDRRFTRFFNASIGRLVQGLAIP